LIVSFISLIWRCESTLTKIIVDGFHTTTSLRLGLWFCIHSIDRLFSCSECKLLHSIFTITAINRIKIGILHPAIVNNLTVINQFASSFRDLFIHSWAMRSLRFIIHYSHLWSYFVVSCPILFHILWYTLNWWTFT